MFVFLALAFGIGFVVFNVGSGGGGTGIGDLLLTPQGGTDAPSADNARERIAENRNDAQAYRDLATALETEGKIDEAVSALESYTALRPRDADAKRELAGLYLSRADRFRTRAQAAQAEGGPIYSGVPFAPPAETDLGQMVGQDPITRAVSTRVNERVNAAFTEMQTAYRLAVSVYRDLVNIQPRDPSLQLELAQAAEAAGENDTAIAAYERFVVLAPDDPNAPAIKERVKLLRSPAAPSG
jgi:tetratricopeptide (TPR) repeat protein